MRSVVFVVPGDIETRTGGYIYDRRIADGLRALGWRVEVRNPRDLAAIADGAIVLVDGLGLLQPAGGVEREAGRLRIALLIHLPLALEVGLPADEASRRRTIERRALDAAALAIVTGRSTRTILEGCGVDPRRIAVVEPGTDVAPIARGSGGGPVSLLSVAALTPGKGHELLLRALAAAPCREWTLTCAGSVDRDPTTAARVRDSITELGLGGRVTLAGELDEAGLADAYDRADVFVLATLRETYGMAVAEAIARGLPVVSTTAGAIPEVVGAGGLLVPPHEEAAFSDALAKVVADPRLRQELAVRARSARARLKPWSDASQAMAAALYLL